MELAIDIRPPRQGEPMNSTGIRSNLRQCRLA